MQTPRDFLTDVGFAETCARTRVCDGRLGPPFFNLTLCGLHRCLGLTGAVSLGSKGRARAQETATSSAWPSASQPPTEAASVSADGRGRSEGRPPWYPLMREFADGATGGSCPGSRPLFLPCGARYPVKPRHTHTRCRHSLRSVVDEEVGRGGQCRGQLGRSHKFSAVL